MKIIPGSTTIIVCIIFINLFNLTIFNHTFAQSNVYAAAPEGYYSNFKKVNELAGVNFTKLVEKSFLNNELSILDAFIVDDTLRNELIEFKESIDVYSGQFRWDLHGHSNSSFGLIHGPYKTDYSKIVPERIYKNTITFNMVERDINVWLYIDYSFELVDSSVQITAFSASYSFKNFGSTPKKISKKTSYPTNFSGFCYIVNKMFNSVIPYSPFSSQVSKIRSNQAEIDSSLHLIANSRGFNYYDRMKSNLDFFLGSEYGSLSWYALENNDPSLALEFAKKGLETAPEMDWIYTNLSLAHLLNDDFKKAKKIYKKYKDKQYSMSDKSKRFKDIFIDDIDALKVKGIKCGNFEKALDYLNK